MRLIQRGSPSLLSICLQTLGLVLIIYSTVQELISAGIAVAPEIDGNSFTAGLGLLAGVSMILIARRRR